MTKLEAKRIMIHLVEAVEAGIITELQARKQFRIVVRNYRNSDKFKNMQESDPKGWQAASKLMGA